MTFRQKAFPIILEDEISLTPTQPIDRLSAPKTMLQRIVNWAARRVGLVEVYCEPIRQTKTRRIVAPDDMVESLKAQILGFFSAGARPSTDLVILMGHKDYGDFVRRDGIGVEFGPLSLPGGRFFDVRVVLVPYLEGAIVCRRDDLRL